MANNFGTLFPEIVTLACLQWLKKKFPVLTAYGHDFSDEQVKLNSTVVSRVVTPPIVQSYSSSTGYAASNAVTTDVPVTLNQFRYVSLSFFDSDLSSTNRNLVAEQTEAAAYSLGKDASDQMCALMNVGNYAQHVVATAASFGRSTLASVREALITAGAASPFNGLINAIAFQNLSIDPTVQSRFTVNVTDGTTNLVDGEISGFGFEKISEYADLSVTNAGTTGFFGGRDAILLAGRVASDPTQFVTDLPIDGIIRNVTDPATGLTMQYRYHYDIKMGRLDMILAWIFGVAVGVTGHAVLTTTT